MSRGGYAVIRVSDFPLHALRRIDPDLAGKPCAIVAGEGRKAAVVAASTEAAGVEPGLAAALALARCPGIVLRARDPEAEAEAQGLLLAAAFALSPRAELTAPGCCTADLRGDDPARTRAAMRGLILDLRRAGLPACIGRAATPFTALCAAQQAATDFERGPAPEGQGGLGGSAASGPILEVDDDRVFLRPLPVALAGPTPVQAEVLTGWGIRTLGELADLPKAGIADRLGTEGAALWERAGGTADRLLRLAEPARSYAAAWDHEPPVESLEPLLFRLRRFGERIAFELRSAGLAAESLALTLVLEDGGDHRRSFRLPEPDADPEGWMRVLHSHLATVRTSARVCGARLAAVPTRAPEKQEGLFETGLRDPALFWENLARVGAVVGEGRVGEPLPADTHRPDSFTLGRPAVSVPPPGPPPVHPSLGLTLRRFRPAWPVTVALAGGRPAEIGGAHLRGTVTACLGPVLASGDWWGPAPWSAETWRVELAGGGLYQVVRTPEGWCVDGMFD